MKEGISKNHPANTRQPAAIVNRLAALEMWFPVFFNYNMITLQNVLKSLHATISERKHDFSGDGPDIKSQDLTEIFTGSLVL